jgi:hypothetical protein
MSLLAIQGIPGHGLLMLADNVKAAALGNPTSEGMYLKHF